MAIENDVANLATLEVPTITRATLALFAGASGDHNPIHIDLDFARAAGFDDVFSHGMLSMAYLSRVLTDSYRPEHVRSFSARFQAITPVLERPICTARVTNIAGATRRVELEAHLQDGTQTISAVATVTEFPDEPVIQKTQEELL